MTEAQAQAHLDAWLAADLAVANGQSYSIGGRSLSRADAEEIRKNIIFWQNKVAEISSGGLRQRRAVPRDI